MITVRIAGVPEPYNLPWHLAIEQEAFTQAGIDLQWHTVPEGTGRMCQMLRDGDLDMAVLVTEGAVRDILNGGKHRIVSTFVESPLPWDVHVSANSALRTPEVLKGVPFAISRKGSGSHLMAMLYAQRLGCMLDEADFIIVNNMEGAADRMMTGEPMVFLWEKFVTAHYVEAGVMRRVEVINTDWPGFVIVARQDAIASKAEVIRAILRIVREQAASLMHDVQGPERIAERYAIGLSNAHEWFAGVQWSTSGEVDSGALSRVVKSLRSVGVIGVRTRSASGLVRAL